MPPRIPGQPPAKLHGKSNPEYVRLWHARHPEYKERMRAYDRGYRAANPEKRRASIMRCKYGISPDDFESMRVRQLYACAICRQDFSDTLRPHIDHDHRSGRVRGLLCGPCNRALHHVEDVTFREAALRYLKEHSDE